MITKKAFSLVEILVVVTIIALLASLAAASYSQFVKQARDAKRKTDVEQIRAAIELYRNFDASGLYPATAAIVFGTGNIADASATYLTKIPNDPLSSRGYTLYYTNVSPFTNYTLCAYLENGGTAVAGTICGSASLQCNYCTGPYGQK